MAGLGSLTIDLQANISRFEKSLNRAEHLAEKRSKGIQRVFSRLAGGLGAALAGAGFIRAVDSALDYADAIGKTADKLGIATDSLQEYRFAAEQTGVAQKALDIGIQRFNRRLGEAQTGAGVLKEVFNDLNINLKDTNGEFKDSETILGEYANAIKGTTNEQQQLLLAFKAFDTEGVALVNLMRQGAEGINGFRQEARDLGIVMDEELIRNAEKANDQLNVMGKVMKVTMTEAAVQLAPAITEVATAFANMTKGDVAALPAWGKDIAFTFKIVETVFNETGDSIGFLASAISLLFQGEFAKVGAIWDARQSKSRDAAAGVQAYIDKLFEMRGAEDAAGLGSGTLGSAADDPSGSLIEGGTNIITGQTTEQMDADFAAYESILTQGAAAHKRLEDQKLRDTIAFNNFKKANDRAAFGDAVGLLSALGSKHKSFAIAAIALQKGLAIAEVFISTQAGAQKALEIYGPTPAGYAAAHQVQAIGAIRMGLIAATGLVQAGNLSAASGGSNISGAAGTVGTDVNPITTTESLAQGGTQGSITINVNGVVTEEILQDLIIPAIQDATNDKDVILFRSDSRQAIELEA